MALILASGSPRRRELMRYITDDFTVRVSDAEETAPAGLAPGALVEYLAKQKGDAVFRSCEADDVVVSADTIVFADGNVLGKPHDETQAREMLRALSGRIHTVYTGVYIRSAKRTDSFYTATDVEFYPLTEDEISEYIATGEPFDKAGGYGIQTKGGLLVKGIRGDYYNVVGFPLAEVRRALRAYGI